MRWITPPEKDQASNALARSPWEAADHLRANSGLTPQQYALTTFELISRVLWKQDSVTYVPS